MISVTVDNKTILILKYFSNEYLNIWFIADINAHPEDSYHIPLYLSLRMYYQKQLRERVCLGEVGSSDS